MQKHLLLVPFVLAACTDPEPVSNVIDHGDGTYSREALPGRNATTTKHEGAFTWSYVGQARHSWVPLPMTSMSYIVAEPRLESDEEQIRAVMREDADGSLWRVAAVDMPIVRDQIAKHDSESIDRDHSRSTVRPPRATPAVEPVGSLRTIQTNSWTGSSCDNHYYMGDDDRVLVDPTTSSRRKAVVDVRVSGATACTGVILRSEWVLTSAHCIFDSNQNLIPRNTMTVARWDGVGPTIIGLSARFWDGGYTTSWDPKDDWALLKLAAPLTAPFSDMDIAGASDTTLGNVDHIDNLAFPQFAPNCNDNINGAIVDNMWLNSVGELGAIANQKINFKIDGGYGHSGSPVFYCPNDGNDSCTGNEQAFVIAVWTGWNGFETTMVGPKGPSFRNTATTTMDNN